MPGIRRGVPEGVLEGARVILLDWDIVSLSQGGVVPWLQHVREMTMAWFFRLRPDAGVASGVDRAGRQLRLDHRNCPGAGLRAA